jgi:hypothetical protein
MVTHSSTSRPVQCLCMAERTGCPVFTDLWSYVLRSFYVMSYSPFCFTLAQFTDIDDRCLELLKICWSSFRVYNVNVSIYIVLGNLANAADNDSPSRVGR